MRSTISSGDARSIPTVRGLRCSVTRGSLTLAGTSPLGTPARKAALGAARRLRGLTYPARSSHRKPPRGDVMVRRFALGLLLLATAAPVLAQAPFPRLPLRPNAWASLSVGLYNLADIYDPESD